MAEICNASLGKYIYGIILGESKSNGVMYAIPHQDISAYVTNSEIVDYTHMRMDILARQLVGHQTVIERLMAQGTTIIPMKLGTFAQDENEVKDILNIGYNLIKEIFEKIKNKIEIDIAVTWSNFNSMLKELGEEKEIKEFKKKLLSNPKGITVDDQIKMGFMLKKALDKKRTKFAREIQESLNAVSEDSRIHEPMGDDMVINAAFLIYKAKYKDFEEKIEELNTTMCDNLNFRCIGPLPPYSYYTLEVKKLEFGEIDWARKKLKLFNNITTRNDIKKAHQTMVFSFHPDKNPNTPGIEKEFDEITKAYNILYEYCQNNQCSFTEDEFKKNAILVNVLSSEF